MALRIIIALVALRMTLQPAAQSPAQSGAFHFVLIGDRTGETIAGVYEKVWREIAGEHPAFVLSIGDTIQGLDDSAAETEWRDWERIVAPYRQFPIHLAPGNHDIWSEPSVRSFRKHAGSLEHYSFDYGPAHFTVLDNSRADAFTDAEMKFLEGDLKAHESQRVKFVVSHRPSWILNALLRNPDFPFHQLMRRYGVQYVIAGHVHEMLHYSLEGVEYVSLGSAGGHLRATEKYEDGWFFGYTSVDVKGTSVTFQIHELNGRTTPLDAWGQAGLVTR